MSKLIDSQSFNVSTGAPKFGENVFKYCEFDGLNIEGGMFDGLYVGCRVVNCDNYWGLFNGAAIINTDFENCVFRGTSFRGCKFVASTFARCRFVLDNLGGTCTFDDCAICDCTFEDCHFVLDSPGKQSKIVFTKTRFYGCKQSKCIGLETAF